MTHGGVMGGGVHGGYGYGGYNRGYGGYNRGYYGHGYYGRGYGFSFYGGYWPYWGYGYWDPYWSGYGYGYPYYPYYSSYPYYSGYYYPDYSTANVTTIYPPQYTYTQPQRSDSSPGASIREYRDEYGQSRDITYLIAFKDGTIRAAVAYWADNNTLHYVTRDHQEHTVSLDQVDRSFSERLNRDQRVPFRLP
jgi:hypothetical protein